MTVRSSPMPPTSCGARTAFGCSRWTTAGAGYSPPSSIGTPSVSAGMCANEATVSPPFNRSPWALRGCITRPPPVRLGGLALRMDHGSQYLSDHFTNQIKFWGIQPSYAFVERAPDQRRRREVQSYAQGTDHPWPHLPQHRRTAGRRPQVRQTVQCPVDRGEEPLLEPRSSPSGVGRHDVTQARRLRQTYVQGTGCDTTRTTLIDWISRKDECHLAGFVRSPMGNWMRQDRFEQTPIPLP